MIARASPFRSGLHVTFLFAILACLIAASASALRGGRYHHAAEAARTQPQTTIGGQ